MRISDWSSDVCSSGLQLVGAGVAEARGVDVGADRGGAAGRAEHADHEAGLAGRLLPGGIAAFAGDARAFRVEFVDQVLQVVVGLADRGGIEGVGDRKSTV